MVQNHVTTDLIRFGMVSAVVYWFTTAFLSYVHLEGYGRDLFKEVILPMAS